MRGQVVTQRLFGLALSIIALLLFFYFFVVRLPAGLSWNSTNLLRLCINRSSARFKRSSAFLILWLKLVQRLIVRFIWESVVNQAILVPRYDWSDLSVGIRTSHFAFLVLLNFYILGVECDNIGRLGVKPCRVLVLLRQLLWLLPASVGSSGSLSKGGADRALVTILTHF